MSQCGQEQAFASASRSTVERHVCFAKRHLRTGCRRVIVPPIPSRVVDCLNRQMYTLTVELEQHAELLKKSMGHTYNRTAFLATSMATLPPQAPPLVVAYSSLVAIELCLSEYLLGQGDLTLYGHNVPEMIQALQSLLPAGNPTKGTLNQLVVELQNRLAGLWCVDAKRKTRRVPSRSYPYIRYIRHISDWPQKNCTDAQIQNLINTLQSVKVLLRAVTGMTI